MSVAKSKMKLTVPVPKHAPGAPKTPGAMKAGPARPHFKRAKMSVMGKSAYGTGGKRAFPTGPAAMGALGAPPAGGGAGLDMGDMGGGAPMPPNAAPDNIGG